MDHIKVWGAVLSEIELKVSRPTFATFFSKTRLDSLKDGKATISVGNPLVKEIIENRYYRLIQNLIEKHSLEKTGLVFKIDTLSKTEALPGPLFTDFPSANFEDVVLKSHLNPLHTFENFAVSGSNQMAYAAARAVVQSPGHAYNPLFLYGGVGVGKTHLMQAIGIELLKKRKDLKIVSSTGEEFTNEIIEAIRAKNTQRFKNKFRSAQIFLIDDVQFIAGKNAVQEEFFYTFNTIHRKGSQIVLVSDRPPSEISKLEERLRSRFEGGLLIDIQSPDFELRTAIVLIKAKQRGADLPMNIAQEIASQVSDARKLEGILIRLLTEAEVRKEPISLSLLRQLFGKNLKPIPYSAPLSPSVFFNAVAKYFNVKASLLKSASRPRPIAYPRQILMYILRTELGLSLSEIGSFLGGRDHTTILHGVGKITNLLRLDEKLQKDIFSIKSLVGEK